MTKVASRCLILRMHMLFAMERTARAVLTYLEFGRYDRALIFRETNYHHWWRCGTSCEHLRVLTVRIRRLFAWTAAGPANRPAE